MEQGNAQESFAVGEANYDALYRGKSGLDEMDLSFDGVPWDIGGPQPAIVELERVGEFRGAILDVGCGTGDNAVFLAQRGYVVTGVDASSTALENARERAGQCDTETLFVLDDVTSLGKIESLFDTVLDSALYHCLGQEQRRRYSAALHRVTRPGATLHLFCFADEGPGCFPAPFQVSMEDLRANLNGNGDFVYRYCAVRLAADPRGLRVVDFARYRFSQGQTK